MKNQVVRARIENALKVQAQKVLASLGLDLSDAIRLFLRQVVSRKGLPFPMRNQGGPGLSPAQQSLGAKITTSGRDRAVAERADFFAGELFLIDPKDARTAKIEWPSCRLND